MYLIKLRSCVVAEVACTEIDLQFDFACMDTCYDAIVAHLKRG